jgi:regulatory protein
VDPNPGPPTHGRALAVAYEFINARERTVAEVRARLERAELPAGEIEAAIAELVEFGYLDDARYARVFAQDKRALESWGADRIARTLAARGVERELIAAALDGWGGDADRVRAIELLRRRFESPPADLRACERALGVLIRKGYASEIAYEAVRAWAGAGALGAD